MNIQHTLAGGLVSLLTSFAGPAHAEPPGASGLSQIAADRDTLIGLRFRTTSVGDPEDYRLEFGAYNQHGLNYDFLPLASLAGPGTFGPLYLETEDEQQGMSTGMGILLVGVSLGVLVALLNVENEPDATISCSGFLCPDLGSD